MAISAIARRKVTLFGEGYGCRVGCSIQSNDEYHLSETIRLAATLSDCLACFRGHAFSCAGARPSFSYRSAVLQPRWKSEDNKCTCHPSYIYHTLLFGKHVDTAMPMISGLAQIAAYSVTFFCCSAIPRRGRSEIEGGVKLTASCGYFLYGFHSIAYHHVGA